MTAISVDPVVERAGIPSLRVHSVSYGWGTKCVCVCVCVCVSSKNKKGFKLNTEDEEVHFMLDRAVKPSVKALSAQGPTKTFMQ